MSGPYGVEGGAWGMSMATRDDGPAIVCFLAVTLLLSAVFWTLMISAGHVDAGAGKYVAGLMWCPAIAAFFTVRFWHLDPKTLGLTWGPHRYALAGYLIPLAYAAVAYVLVWSLGFGFFPDPAAIAAIDEKLGWTLKSPAAFLPSYFLLMATTAMISALAHGLGEEIGWRGFLAPRLVGHLGFTAGSLLTGAIWALWHMPLLLFADYNSGNPWWFALPCFCVLTIALSVVMTWLRLVSRSVWPCAILHASHNLFIQGFFTPLTGAKGPYTSYAIDEFGVAVPAMIALLAFAFWRLRARALSASAV